MVNLICQTYLYLSHYGIKVTEAIAEREHLEDELARCKQTLQAAQEVSADIIAQAHHHIKVRGLAASGNNTSHPGVARSAPGPPTSPAHLPSKADLAHARIPMKASCVMTCIVSDRQW